VTVQAQDAASGIGGEQVNGRIRTWQRVSLSVALVFIGVLLALSGSDRRGSAHSGVIREVHTALLADFAAVVGP
jgi:hypothetical protein